MPSTSSLFFNSITNGTSQGGLADWSGADNAHSEDDAYAVSAGVNSGGWSEWLQFQDIFRSQVNISAATKANPCVITTGTPHGCLAGDQIVISGVVGMTQLNGNTYTVANPTSTTLELSSVNSTGYSTYTSGGILRRLGAGLPPGANPTTIVPILFEYYLSGMSFNSGGIVDHDIQLIKGGVIQGNNNPSATPWHNTDDDSGRTYSIYGTWGLSLTAADVNARDFGFAIRVKGVNFTISNASVDLAQIEIVYDEAIFRTPALKLKLQSKPLGQFTGIAYDTQVRAPILPLRVTHILPSAIAGNTIILPLPIFKLRLAQLLPGLHASGTQDIYNILGGITPYGYGSAFDVPILAGIKPFTGVPIIGGIESNPVSPPLNVLAAHIGAGSVYLTWDIPAQGTPDYYELWASSQLNGNYFPYGVPFQATSFTVMRGIVHNIPMGTTAYLKLRAIGKDGSMSTFTQAKRAAFVTPDIEVSVRAIYGSRIPGTARFTEIDEDTERLLSISATETIPITC